MAKETQATPDDSGWKRRLLTLFFLVILGTSLWIGSYWVRDVLRVVEAYGWTEQTCVIEESWVDVEGVAPEPYGFRVAYRYQVGENVYHGDRYRDGYLGTKDVSDAERLAAEYPEGAKVPCLVDPDDPGWSVLERRPLGSALAAGLIPLVFFGLGLFGLKQVRASGPARPTTWGCLAASAVFLVFGVGMLIPLWILPTWRAVTASDWQEVPCTIERIWMAGEADTSSVGVLFSYQVEGRSLKSSRFDFSMSSSSDHESHREAVDRHPVGADTCWVDPRDPFAAVVERRAGGTWWHLLLLPFVLLGAVGTFSILSDIYRQRRS